MLLDKYRGERREKKKEREGERERERERVREREGSDDRTFEEGRAIMVKNSILGYKEQNREGNNIQNIFTIMRN